MSTDQGSYVALAASWADDPWFRFPRAFIRDARLSSTARAVAAWMASHSTRFRFDVPAMVKANLGGRDKVRKALKELEKHGYLVRTRERNPDGSFGRIFYELYPVPQENPSSAPATENQSLAPETENQAPDTTSGNTEKPQVKTGDLKPGPGFQGGYKGEQLQIDQKKEGEEGDARARAGGEPSPVDEPQWGVAGGHRPAAPSGASASLIAGIARSVLLEGEGLTPEEHRELAALADMARSVVDQQRGLSWEEYTAWLRQGWIRADGRRAFRNLPGALRWRLAPEQIQTQAWAWACEQRGAKEASEARGGRDIPKQQAKVHVGTCGLHKVALTDQGKCLRCEHEEAEEFRQREAARAAAAAENGQDYVDYDEPDLEEIDPEELAQMYRSLGTPPTEAWQAARRAMEEARVGSAGDLTYGDRRESGADPTRD